MGKLIKYEFRNSRKPVIQIILIMMIAWVILQLGIFSSLKSFESMPEIINNQVNGFQQVLLTLIPIFIFVSIIVFFGATFVYYFRMANILKRDIYEDQGYIAFSIPKNGYQIIGSKIIVAMIWTIILPIIMIIWNIGVFMLLSFILRGGNAINEFYNFIFVEFPNMILDTIKNTKVFVLITWLLNHFVSSIYFIILMYASIVIDYNAGTRSKSSLRWILWLLLLSITIGVISNAIFPIQYGYEGMMDMEVSYDNTNFDLLMNLKGNMLSTWLKMLFTAIVSGLLFIYTSHNFEKKIEK